MDRQVASASTFLPCCSKANAESRPSGATAGDWAASLAAVVASALAKRNTSCASGFTLPLQGEFSAEGRQSPTWNYRKKRQARQDVPVAPEVQYGVMNQKTNFPPSSSKRGP